MKKNKTEHYSIYDIPISWNSTLHMLKRIEELKDSLRLYAASNSKIPLLTNFEWIVLSGCVRSLEPFEEITKKNLVDLLVQ